MLINLIAAAVGGSLKINLNDDSITDAEVDGTAEAGIRIDANGNVYALTDNLASADQIFLATDWARPTTFAPGAYQVRFTGASGTITASTAAEDVWHPLSSGDFQVSTERVVGAGDGSTVGNLTIEIREGTGPVLASADYVLTATVIIL